MDSRPITAEKIRARIREMEAAPEPNVPMIDALKRSLVKLEAIERKKGPERMPEPPPPAPFRPRPQSHDKLDFGPVGKERAFKD